MMHPGRGDAEMDTVAVKELIPIIIAAVIKGSSAKGSWYVLVLIIRL